MSVVIPTRNRVALLTETLRALFEATPLEACSFEVVVVDDGDGEASQVASAFSGKPLRVLRNSGRGAAAARNCGAAAGRHELLLFLDDDILLPSGCIERHLETHERFPRALVSGVARPAEDLLREAEGTAFGRYKLRFDYPLDNAGRVASRGYGVFRVDRVASFCLSILREDFSAVGGFDERFPHAGCEDQEFSLRAHARGFEPLLDEGITCVHNERDRLSPEAWLRRQDTGVQGAVLLAHLYPEGKMHPVYVTFSPASPGDPLKLRMRKRLVAALATGPLPTLLLRSLLAFEQWRIPDPIVFKGYHLLWALHTHRGFREGLRRLEHLESVAADR